MAILNQPGFANMAGAPQALQAAYMRDPRLRLAQQLQLQGADSSPVQHWTQGAARLAQALAGGYVQDKADAEYAKQAGDYQNDMRALYAPVQEMKPGQSGAGPRPDAQMTTRAPSIQEILARGQNLQSPYSQDQLRQFQMMNMQQQAAQEAEARKPFNLRPGERRMTPDGRVMAENPLAEKPQAPPALVAEFQFAKAQGFPGNFMDYQRTRAESTRPQTTVNIPGEDSFSRGMGTATVEAIQTARTQAQSGLGTIQATRRIQDLLDSGVITGTGAELRLSLERGLATAGLIDGKRVTNTEQLLAEISNNVLARTEQMKGVLTDRDIEFLKDAAAGRISLTPETIRRVSEISERGSMQLVENYNSMVGPLADMQNVPQAARNVFGLMNVPTRTPPQGQGKPPAPAPQQTQAPAMPPGVTPEMIQAEIARRGLGAAR
jgi:hypothetical protein